MAECINIPFKFFEEPIIQLIKSQPDGDSIILLYINMLFKSYAKHSDGSYAVANLPLSDDVLAIQFKFENIGEKLRVLEKYGLIERKKQVVFVNKFWKETRDRSSPRYKTWRTAVFARDGFRCQICGSKHLIQAHHIQHWRDNVELRYEVDNGVTLCRPCHLQAHGGSWRG